MSQQFSQELKERLKRYFEKCHSLTISDDEAEEYLDSLSELYLRFDAMRKKRVFREEKDAFRKMFYLII